MYSHTQPIVVVIKGQMEGYNVQNGKKNFLFVNNVIYMYTENTIIQITQYVKYSLQLPIFHQKQHHYIQYLHSVYTGDICNALLVPQN